MRGARQTTRGVARPAKGVVQCAQPRPALRSGTCHPASRSGYTLFELLLVLAVLLIVVGLTWSSLAGAYKHQRLASAAHDVRMRLAATRAQAIESGAILQFVYEPGARAYSVLPLEQTVDTGQQ